MSEPEPKTPEDHRCSLSDEEAHGRPLPGVGRSKKGRKTEGRMVHLGGSGGTAPCNGLSGLLPGKPRRTARRHPNGNRLYPGRQFDRILTGYMLVPHVRRWSIPERCYPADQSLRSRNQYQRPMCWSTTPISAATSRTGLLSMPGNGTFPCWAFTLTETSRLSRITTSRTWRPR